MTASTKRRLRLAAGVPGVNHWTVWSAPGAGSQIDFSTFEHVARTAERGFFDYFFLAEGLRVREHKGRIHELDVAGRPDNLSVLAAVAAVTEHIGLVGTASATYNEPYDLARKLASLDHLSGGRAGWNVVTSSDAFTGANFRRGGYLAYEDRYRRAEEFVALSRLLWDSWSADGPQPYRFAGEFFDTHGWFPVEPGPQGRPVLVQAGDSPAGRDFAVRTADVVFSRHGEPVAGRAFRADVRARALAAGRDPDSILVVPAVSVVLGDTTAEAEERARELSFQQVTPQTAIHLLEQVWGTDLSTHDPDGPVPAPPTSAGEQLTHGQARRVDDPLAAARQWHALAAERGWSIRELVAAQTTRHEFVGTPSSVAAQLDDAAQTGAADGYVLSGAVVPHGIDEFVDRVVPLLQERGVLRTEYEHPTLRANLGLDDPSESAGHGEATARVEAAS